MSLLSILKDRINDATIQRMSDQIDAKPSTTRQAVDTALPLLVGALARNANASSDAASSLAGALDRDHDGAMLDNVSSVIDLAGKAFGGSSGSSSGGGLGGLLSAASSILGGSATKKAVDGSGILGHVFGSRQSAVMTGIAKLTGLDRGQVQSLLAILAPIVMSALAKRKQEQNLDAQGIANALDEERRTIEDKTDGMTRGGLKDLLDRNDDGSIADDIVDIGSKLRGLF
jgi:hypothetical protein